MAQEISAVLPPQNQHNQQQDPAMVNGGGANQLGGGQGQGLEHSIANVIVKNAPVLAQAISAVLPPQYQHGGGQGQGLEHIIANVIIQNAPVFAQAFLALYAPQNQQQDPAMVS
jgi:hypothetical protein